MAAVAEKETRIFGNVLNFREPENIRVKRLLKEAECLLREIYQLDRSKVGLALCSINHQELDFLVKQFPKGFFDRNLLPELKSYRLAFAISIEKMQTPST